MELLGSQEGFCSMEVDDRNVIATTPFGFLFFMGLNQSKNVPKKSYVSIEF
jgi:hypothetical protein